MMLCGIFVLLMLWICDGARLAGEDENFEAILFNLLIWSGLL